MGLNTGEMRCDDISGLACSQQRAGIDTRDWPRGDEPRCIFSLASPVIAEPKSGETAIQNVLGIVHVRVPDYQNLSKGRDFDGNRCAAQTVLRGQHG